MSLFKNQTFKCRTCSNASMPEKRMLFITEHECMSCFEKRCTTKITDPEEGSIKYKYYVQWRWDPYEGWYDTIAHGLHQKLNGEWKLIQSDNFPSSEEQKKMKAESPKPDASPEQYRQGWF